MIDPSSEFVRGVVALRMPTALPTDADDASLADAWETYELALHLLAGACARVQYRVGVWHDLDESASEAEVAEAWCEAHAWIDELAAQLDTTRAALRACGDTMSARPHCWGRAFSRVGGVTRPDKILSRLLRRSPGRTINSV